MSCPGSIGRAARGWFVPFLALALAGVLTLPGACRQAVSASTPPVRLAIGYADTKTGAVSVGVIVSLLEDEQLVKTGRDGRPQVTIAERWEQSPDGLRWRFHLRPGLKFQDGTPLDANLVAAGLRRDLADYRTFAGVRDITEIEAAGPLELVVHLRRPSSLVLASLSYIPIKSPGHSAIGPYHSLTRNVNGATLEAFNVDARPRSNVDHIDIRPYPSARNAWSAMMRGEVDMLLEIPPDAIEFVEQSSHVQLKSFLRPYLFMLGLNLHHPVLRSRDVRRALNTAVNRDDIIKRIFRGHGVPAAGHVFPRNWAYDQRIQPFDYAPSEAQRLLDAAGLPVQPSTDRRMPSRFRFTCLVPIGERYERMGLMLQRQLVDVGIDMQLEPLPVRALRERLQSGQYDAYLFEMAAPSLDWTYSFWHSPEPPSPAFVDSGYSAADPMLDALRIAQTDEQIRAAVVGVQRVMRDDPPAIFLLWNETTRVVNARFRVPDIPDRDILATIPQWQLAAPDQKGLPTLMPTAAPSTAP
jgi:peptide/nickel transport system substrate-binding protein